MRIATKLSLLLMAAVAVVMAGFGYIRAQQERQRLIDEVRQEVLVLSRALRLTVEYALRDRQFEDIRQLLTAMVRGATPVDRIRIFDRRLEDMTGAITDEAATTLVPQADLEQALQKGEEVVRYLDGPPRPAAYAILPLKNRRGAIIGVLEVVHVAARVEREIQAATQDQIVRLSLLSLTIALVIWLTVRVSIRRPVAELVGAALALGGGDLSRRISLRRRDEIGQLAAAFNRMAERIQEAREQIVAEAQARWELERQVQQAQKMAAVGHLASEVAHEIGTPLNIISGRAEAIQKGLPSDHPSSRHVITILRQIERIGGIIRQLLEYTRPRMPRLRPIAADACLARAADLLEPLARRRQVAVQALAPAGLPRLLADSDQLQQVLLNLVTNALDATPAGGRVLLSAHPGEVPNTDGRPALERGRAEGPYLTLSVQDTGAGMRPEQLEQIFEPFFSTKAKRGGTGLGMAIVEDIVRAHRGAIEVRTAPGAGTTVLLKWPSEDRESGTRAGHGPSQDGSEGDHS